MDRRTAIELIKQYLAILSNEGISIEKAFLYGSYLNNSATDESDIDLMLVSNNIDSTNDLLIGKIWYLTKKINTKIEPFIVSTQKFISDESSPLIQLVKSEGFQVV